MRASSPRNLELREATLEDVAALAFTTDEVRLALPLKLRAARLLPDGRVEVDLDGAVSGELLVTAGMEPTTAARVRGGTRHSSSQRAAR